MSSLGSCVIMEFKCPKCHRITISCTNPEHRGGELRCEHCNHLLGKTTAQILKYGLRHWYSDCKINDSKSQEHQE